MLVCKWHARNPENQSTLVPCPFLAKRSEFFCSVSSMAETLAVSAEYTATLRQPCPFLGSIHAAGPRLRIFLVQNWDNGNVATDNARAPFPISSAIFHFYNHNSRCGREFISWQPIDLPEGGLDWEFLHSGFGMGGMSDF